MILKRYAFSIDKYLLAKIKIANKNLFMDFTT